MHDKSPQDAMSIASSVCALATNFTAAYTPKDEVICDGWCPPPRGLVKLNVDACFNSDMLQGSLGVVIRNENRCKRIEWGSDALKSEAMPLRFWALYILSVSYNKIIVNYDILKL